MNFCRRRAVAPVIATLLMVAIAVVGGMLVFVFAQDFFTQTESMTGPTIELAQIYGYDFRDTDVDGQVRNHEGALCINVQNSDGGTLEDDDHVSIFIRNHGIQPIFIDSVSVFGAALVEAAASGLLATTPGQAEWGLVVADTCTGFVPADSNPIFPGENATIIIGWDQAFLPSAGELKVGRPINVSVTTDAGNVLTKNVINGRSIG